jgi:hypothetical protein
VVLGFELSGLHLEPLHQPIFCDACFQDSVSQTISPDWLWMAILLISASWLGRIPGVGHRHPVSMEFCLGILPVNILYFDQPNPLYYSSLPFLPTPCCSKVFSAFHCVLFLHRFVVFRYYSPLTLFFPSSPSPWARRLELILSKRFSI